MIEFEYVSFEEVYKAYKDCCKNKKRTANAAAFEIDEYKNVYKLYVALNTKTYKIGRSITFLAEVPK